jgi:hypothetical protein
MHMVQRPFMEESFEKRSSRCPACPELTKLARLSEASSVMVQSGPDTVSSSGRAWCCLFYADFPDIQNERLRRS